MSTRKLQGNKSAKGQGFDNNPQNINRTGLNRKSPMTKYLQEISNQEDGYSIKVSAIKNAIVKKEIDNPLITIVGEYSVDEFGNKEEYIKINIPNSEAIAMQWAKDAKSKNSKIRIRSRESLIDRLEGKAKQTINLKIDADDFNAGNLCPEVLKFMEYLLLIGAGKEECERNKLTKFAKKLIKDLDVQ